MNELKSKPLVSIITPCFNGETYVHRLLDSVLNQTYGNIEFIFVNDGSTDRTEDIVLSYKERFEGKGIKFTYLYQENAGQAAAVNKALKLFKGDYLTWPDSDDWMSDDCIEKKVNFLEEHKEHSIVMCRIAVVNESNTDDTVATLYRRYVDQHDLFDDFITERDVYFAPVGYMVRSCDFLDALPSRDIYEGRGGQNWQLLLPISYKYTCGYIDEILGYYLTRASSHSRSDKTYIKLLDKYKAHEEILTNTLQTVCMSEDEREYYAKLIDKKYSEIRFSLAFSYGDRNLLKESYDKTYKGQKAPLKVRIKYIFGRSRILYWIYKKIRK